MGGVIGGWLLKVDGQSAVFFACSGLVACWLIIAAKLKTAAALVTKDLAVRLEFEQRYRSKRDGANHRAVSNREGASPRYLGRVGRAPSIHVPQQEKYMSTTNLCYLLLAAHYFSIAAVYVFAALSGHT